MAGGTAIQLNDAHMASGGPSFFQGAPLSKAIVFFVVLMFVLAETMGWHDEKLLLLDWDRVMGDELELWRVFSCRLTFENVGGLLFGLACLCPQLRRFEREMGSRRFATFVAFVSSLSTVLEFLVAQMFVGEPRASGPYALLGGLLYLYHTYTPRLHPKFFGVLGFDFSEKAIQYALVFQLLYASSVSAVLPTTCGMMGAYLCVTPALRLLERYALPNVVYRLGSMMSGPFVEGNLNNRPPPQPTMRRQRPPPNNNRPAAAPIPQFPVTPPPSEEKVESLTSMGFEREAVMRTLQQCDNNVEVAANRLLSA